MKKYLVQVRVGDFLFEPRLVLAHAAEEARDILLAHYRSTEKFDKGAHVFCQWIEETK